MSHQLQILFCSEFYPIIVFTAPVSSMSADNSQLAWTLNMLRLDELKAKSQKITNTGLGHRGLGSTKSYPT